MFCEKCGKQIIEGNSFCTGCGNRVTFPNEMPKQEELQTEPAIAQVETNPVATIADEASISEDLAPAMVKRKSNKGLVVTISICAVLLAVLIGLLAFFAVNGGLSDTTDEKPGVSDTGRKKQKPAEKKPPKKPQVNEIDTDTITSYINALDHTDFAIYVYNYANGYEFGYNEDLSLPASAMCQVAILDTLSKAVKDKKLDIDTETMEFSYMPNGKEALRSPGQDGKMLPLRDYITDVAAYGDNNKSNQLVDYIGYLYDDNGFNVINDTLRDNGAVYTSINRKVYTNSAYIDHNASPNFTTAKEISKVFDNLINKCSYGDAKIMKDMFISTSNDGTIIGLKKYVPSEYSIASVNGFNSQSTNDVAIIGNGDTELLVAILAYTNEDYKDTENNDAREAVQKNIIDYIMMTQFED